MKSKIFFVILLSIVLFSFSVYGQMKMIKKGGKDGNIFMINELAVIVNDADGSVIVEHAMPADNRPEQYRNIKIKNDDEILMVNKKRVKSVKELEDIYNEAEKDETIKMGLQRGDEMFFVEFAKMDPDKLPKRKMMIMTKTIDSDEGGDKVSTKIISDKIMLDDKDGPIEPLFGIGLILQEKNGKIYIIKNLENFEKTKALQEGSEVISINGQTATSLKQVTKIYKELETGEEVTLKVSTGKKENMSTFQKPEENAKKVIRKERN
ncbi:hypothetical protein B6I21_07805 [candidate division KSB1 bacterium 4572_119]|nr:MAG: hypothetical protein B6I21_07805 [candidate division KSB1 bacterium 4572_119]